ncbi:hypothetical protein ACTFIY_011945 [Dictyostelium cf. discoideum]
MSAPQFEEIEPVIGTSTFKLDNQPGSSINLEAISNFRSLGGLPIGDGQNVVRPGVVCRSAGPTNATVSDEFWLLEVLNIKTLIDLRTSWENKTISPVRKFEDNFIQYSIKDDGRPSPPSQRSQISSELANSKGSNLGNSGLGNSGLGNSGLGNSGLGNSGMGNNGLGNSGMGNNSLGNSGMGNNGNSDLSNSGFNNSTNGNENNNLGGSLSSNNNGNKSPNLTSSNSNGGGGVSLRKSGGGIPVAIERKNEKQKDMEEQRNGILWRIYNRNLTPEELTKLRSHSSGVLRKRFCIPLINNKFFLEGVYATAPNDTKLKCNAARYLLFNDQIGGYMLMNHLNDLGIIEMYKLTLIYTKEEILTIFRILKNPDNYPIMYYCSLGKDRTGMVSALLLSALGVSRQVVIDDYAKSEANIAQFIDQIKKYFTRVGLAKDEFVRSHRWTMEGLLTWIDKMYGSVPSYLDNIGFSYQEQEELKANLIVTKEEYDNYLNEVSKITDLQQKHDEYVQLQKSKKDKTPPKLFTSASPRFWKRLSFSRDLQMINDNSR